MPMPAQYSTDSHRYDCFITPRLTEIWKQYVVFYLKKNRMAQHHPPFDKKKCGAMYCRCALFHFFKWSVRSFGQRATTLANYQILTLLWKYKKMLTADRRKRKREEMTKAEAASCRNLMKFFSRYIKCFTRCKIVWTCNEVSIFNQHSLAVVMFIWAW
jgi:hypothetical protein